MLLRYMYMYQGRRLLFGRYGHGRTDFLKVRHLPSLSLHGIILWLLKLASWSYTITIIANIEFTTVMPLLNPTPFVFHGVCKHGVQHDDCGVMQFSCKCGCDHHQIIVDIVL